MSVTVQLPNGKFVVSGLSIDHSDGVPFVATGDPRISKPAAQCLSRAKHILLDLGEGRVIRVVAFLVRGKTGNVLFCAEPQLDRLEVEGEGSGNGPLWP